MAIGPSEGPQQAPPSPTPSQPVPPAAPYTPPVVSNFWDELRKLQDRIAPLEHQVEQLATTVAESPKVHALEDDVVRLLVSYIESRLGLGGPTA